MKRVGDLLDLMEAKLASGAASRLERPRRGRRRSRLSRSRPAERTAGLAQHDDRNAHGDQERPDARATG